MAWEMASFDELSALHDRLKAKGARIIGYSDRQCNVMFLDPDGNEFEAIWEPSKAEAAKMNETGKDMRSFPGRHSEVDVLVEGTPLDEP